VLAQTRSPTTKRRSLRYLVRRSDRFAEVGVWLDLDARNRRGDSAFDTSTNLGKCAQYDQGACWARRVTTDLSRRSCVHLGGASSGCYSPTVPAGARAFSDNELVPPAIGVVGSASLGGGGEPAPVRRCTRWGSGVWDGDGDGVADATDNCPTSRNPDQANENGDKFRRCVPIRGRRSRTMSAPIPTADGIWRFCAIRTRRTKDTVFVVRWLPRLPAWSRSGFTGPRVTPATGCRLSPVATKQPR